MSYREYPDANRGRQIEGALLLTREDKSWLLEPSLTDVIAKGAGGLYGVSTSPWTHEESQPIRIDRLPIENLAARCADTSQQDTNQQGGNGPSFEQACVALVVAGAFAEYVEPAAFDVEAEEGLSLASEGRNTR